MGRALYGPAGFYRAGPGPAAHFATSAQRPLFAGAVLALARRHRVHRVIDLGSGRGELLAHLHDLDAELELHGVEVVPRPPLPFAIRWHRWLPELPGSRTLVVAHEWLDNVPVDVVELTADGPRLVLVDPETGREALGASPDRTDLAWLDQWWPLRTLGHRAEIGRPRDVAWARLVRHLPGALLLAVDYATTRSDRTAGAYAAGTLRAHRAGRLVPPVPDGSRDITAAVALDAVRASGEAAGAATLVETDQRTALADLLEPPRTFPEQLARRELTDVRGPGGFRWLLQVTSGVASAG